MPGSARRGGPWRPWGAGVAHRRSPWPWRSPSSRSSAASARARAQPDRRPIDWLAVALLLAGPVALGLMTRSRVPAVTVVVGVATGTYLVLGYPYGPVVLSLVVALVSAVITGHRLVAWCVAAGVLLAHGVAAGSTRAAAGRGPPRRPPWRGRWSCSPWPSSCGSGARRRSATAGRSPSSVGAAAGEDRLRIARELHDVVAHHMSLINVQASVALHLRGTHPEQVDEALRRHQGREQGGPGRAALPHRGAARGRRPGPAPPRGQPRRARRPRRAHRGYAGLDLTTGTSPARRSRCPPGSTSPRTGWCRRP